MKNFIPAVHSIFDPEALATALWPDYHLAKPIECYLMKCGFNDHYSITTGEAKYVIRVYNEGWRNEEEAAHELALLAYLEAKGVFACGPISQKDGKLYSVIPAIEGSRIATLFPFAPGQAPDTEKPEEIRACGRTLALIHQLSAGFTCEYQRFSLDLKHLINDPVEIMLPLLSKRPSDAAFIQIVAKQLRTGLEAQIDKLEWGYCHGDFHSGNGRIDTNGNLRIFDFDCCGFGWRAYDFAVCQLGWGVEDAQWKTFCEGYKEIRPIPESTWAAIPWFIAVRQLWWIGIHIKLGLRVAGNCFINDSFLDNSLNTLRKRIDKYLPQFTVV